MPSQPKHTTQELIDAYRAHGSVRAAAADLGINGATLHERLIRAGFTDFKKQRLWTEHDDQVVREYYEAGRVDTEGLAPLVAQLGRTKPSIARAAQRMGLTDPSRPSTPAEVAAMSTRVKAWHENHAHPKGFQGRSHSDRVKHGQSTIAKRYWRGVTKDDLAVRRGKTRRTNIERYGTPGPTLLQVTNAHSRSKNGRRADLDGRFFRSRWEANYARYLNWLQQQGQIARWEYEPRTYIFHGVTRAPLSYTPDFVVVECDGRSRVHEVKGWMDSKSRSKLKRMAKFYPDVEIVLIDGAAYKAISRAVAAMLPGWEREGPK